MLTLAQLRDDALSYVGIDDAGQAPETLRQRIVQDINAALQEIYTEGPSFLREKSFSAFLPAPRELTEKAFVTGSVEMSGGSAVADDMIGCTFRITGEEGDNEIVDAATLQNPFQSATTNEGGGIVYSDCIIFPSNVVSIAGPVWLNGKHKLEPLANRTDWQSRVAGRKEIGTPRFYWIEPYHTQVRLRIYPMPSAAYILRYDAQIKAPQVTFLDVWNTLPTEAANTNDILRIDHSDGGIDASLRIVQDNAGNPSALYLSSQAAKVQGDFEVTGSLKRNDVNVVDDSDVRLSDARTPLAHTHTHSDVTDLGDAATKNIGVGSGTVCAGDDSRLSNARTPLAHAGSHISTGLDAIPAVVANGASGLMTGADKNKLDMLLTAAQQQLLLNAKYPSGGVYVASHPSGKMVITDVAGLDLNEKSFTLGLCFAADDWTEATTLIDCVSGSNGFKLEKLAAGTLKLTVGDGTGTITATSSEALPATDGRPSFIHVVVTRGTDDATVDFYCDGVAVGTQQTLTGLALAENVTVPTDLTIKCDGALYGGVFRGLQPVLRNYAMTAAEVAKDVAVGLMFSDIGARTLYESDFSAGTDNWSASQGTATGNVDGVSDGSTSKDNCLRYYANATSTPYHYLYSYRELVGKRVRITFDYYIPNSGGSQYLDGIVPAMSGNYGLSNFDAFTTVGSWAGASLDAVLRTGSGFVLRGRKNGSTTFAGANSATDDLFYIHNFKIEILGYLALIDAEAIGYQKQDLSGLGNHALLGDATPQIGGSILLLTEAFIRSVVNHTADGYLLANQNIIPANYFIDSIVVKNDTANAVTINMGTSVGGSQIVSGAVIGASATVYCTIADRFVAAAAAQKIHISSASWNSASLKTAIVLRKIAA